MNLSINKYDLFARFVPSLVGIIPILLLWYNYLSVLANLQQWIIEIKLFGGISIGIILIFLFVFLIRDLSKKFQIHYFRKTGYPSEYLMQPDSTAYSSTYKEKYYKRLKSQFKIDITAYQDNPNEVRLLLKDGFKLVLENVRANQLVFQQNVRFGFIRNLVGGACFGFLACIALTVIGLIQNSSFLLWSAGLCSLIYIPVIVFNKTLIIRNGEAFADTVFSVFLANK